MATQIDKEELERTIRLLKKPEVQEKWKQIIAGILCQDETWNREEEIADQIIEALINQPVE